MFIFQDSGLLNISYFKFDIDDVTGELEANRPVPFRLTPNLTELITNVGVSGPLTASMIAAARCLVHPSFKIQVTIQTVHSTIPQLSFTCSFSRLFLDLFISTSFILLLLHFSSSFPPFFISSFNFVFHISLLICLLIYWLFQALLRAVLRDEMISWHKKNSDPNVSTIIDTNGQQQVIIRPLNSLQYSNRNISFQEEQFF